MAMKRTRMCGWPKYPRPQPAQERNRIRLDVYKRQVYGYANIPITTPWSAIAEGEMSQEQEASILSEDTLINSGLSQVLNYSFMHKDDLKRLNYPETHKVFNAIPIMNPISEE